MNLAVILKEHSEFYDKIFLPKEVGKAWYGGRRR
jgi:hypothetical protein